MSTLRVGFPHPLLRLLDVPCPGTALLDGITPVAPAAAPEALLGSGANHLSLDDVLFLCQSVLPYSELPTEPGRAPSLGNTD